MATNAASRDALLIDELVDEQRGRAASEARSAAKMVEFVDLRRAAGQKCLGGKSAGELEAKFAADELGLATSTATGTIQRLLARTRRIRSRLPGVWELWKQGLIDGYKIAKIDDAAQRLVMGDSLVVLDTRVCLVAPSKTPSQLQRWLNRFVARTEPAQERERYRRAFGDRTVYTCPSEDGMGWLNACHNQVDLDQVDARLEAMARALGADDPRTIDQRKADVFIALLLGHIPNGATDVADTTGDPADGRAAGTAGEDGIAPESTSTDLVCVGDARPAPTRTPSRHSPSRFPIPAPAPTVIGVTVPVQTLIGDGDVPGEAIDRRSVVPAEIIRQRAVQPGTLFYKLLTDAEGNLLEVSEAGRFASDKLGFAIAARDGTSRFPTSSVPASRCDLDHTIPHSDDPESGGPTCAANLGPLDRRIHNAKTDGILSLRQPRPGEFRWETLTGHRYTKQVEPLPTAQWLDYRDLSVYRPEDYPNPDDLDPTDPILDDLPAQPPPGDDPESDWRNIPW